MKNLPAASGRYITVAILILLIFITVLTAGNEDEYREYYDREIYALLKIVSTPENGEDGCFYSCRLIENENIITDGKYKTNIRIKVKGNKREEYAYGDLIRVNITLKEPMCARNPGNFDYKQYLMTLDISATGVINENVKIVKEGNSPDNIIKMIGIKVNRGMVLSLRRLLPDRESYITEAIFTGNKEYLDEEITGAFNDAGISHFMAVSGSHVVFFLLPVTFLLEKFSLKKQHRYIAEIVAMFIYLTITGFAVPVMRAVIMMSLSRIAFILRKDKDYLISFLLALLIVVLINPYAIYAVGTQLSFGAVFFIKYLSPLINTHFEKYKIYNNLPKQVKSGIALSIAVQVGVLPIMINNFKIQSIAVIGANLICAPLVEVIMVFAMPAFILEFAKIHFLAHFFVNVAYTAGEAVVFIAKYMAIISGWDFINIMQMSAISVLIYYLCLFGIISLKKLKKQYVICLILMVLLNGIIFPTNTLEIVCLDVGQGDSIFFRTPSGNAYMIDCGSSNVKEVGKYRILPFLKSERVDRLSALFITHPDTDHLSAFEELAKDIHIEKLILPDSLYSDDELEKLIVTAENFGIDIVYFKKGNVLIDGNVNINCLHPYPEYFFDTSNSVSIVMEVEYGDFKGLFTGDIEGKGEGEIHDKLGDYDFLKVAHHGSKYSTSNKFLERVKPEIAVISCSESNKYGHPHIEVMDRLDIYADNIFITKESGAVSIKTDGKKLVWEEFLVKG